MDKSIVFITTKNLDYIRNVQEIKRLKQEYNNVEIIGGKSRNYVIRILQVYFKIIFKSFNKIDEIFIGFAPQLILPIFKYKFSRVKVNIDFFISLHDTFCCDRKLFKPIGVLGKFLWYIDKYTLMNAEKIIVDTEAHGKYFVKEFGADLNKMNIFYLEANRDIYNPELYDVKKNEKYTILYFGSILPLQGVDIIIKACNLLKDENILFKIIGPIPSKEKNHSSNIEFIPWMNEKDLAKEIKQADLCLAGHFNKDIGKANRTIPGKAYIYSAMRKPMILGDNAATRELYNESMEGIYFVEMGSPIALADKMREIYMLSKKEGERR